MKITNYPKSWSELVKALNTIEFDPDLPGYHKNLRQEQKIQFHLLASDFGYIYDFYKKDIVLVSEGFERITGHPNSAFKLDFFYDIIHPADRYLVLKASIRTVYLACNYLNVIPFDAALSMDFRVKHADGHYIRLLRQTGVSGNDRKGNMLFTFAIFKDITEIKKSNEISYDMHSINPPPFPLPDDDMNKRNDIFTEAEKKLLPYLAKGRSSQEIADDLFLSKHTVDTHRRNMIKKAQLKNTAELLIFANEKGML